MKNEMKKDAYGNIDVEFYVAQAKVKRDAAIADFFISLKSKLPKFNLHFGRHAH